jgi:endonuclease/exonuclease/phosphatase family metal-dependent hydrolase
VPRLTARSALRAVLLLLAFVWVPWAVLWLVDLEGRSWLVPSAAAFLLYGAAATVLVLLLALVARARAAAIVAAVGLAVLVVPRVGRATSDAQPVATGPRLTVATANVYIGHADPVALERRAAEAGVDVVAIQENTRRWDAAMLRTRLAQRYPHHLSIPGREGRADGLALLSRWPLEQVAPPAGDTRSLGAVIRVPGASGPVQVRSVHPFPPFDASNLECWRRCTRALAALQRSAATTILAGDWNATLDHHPMRDLMASGFRDASEERGLGLRPTWSNGSWGRLTIDHVLVSRGVAVQGVTAHDQPESDHDVLIAQLRLPR